MLASLSVHQFVIVEQLDLDLASGFTVMTGETGAGKSILIDALDLLLGGRADGTVIRDGAQKAELAARFEIQNTPHARAWCEQAGIEPDDQQVLVRRVVDRTGKSRAWINGQPATLTQLKELGETLVDIHGQHAHQALLRPNAQRQLLDAHAELTDQVKSISDIWRAKEKLEALLAQAQTQAERLSLLRDQLNWKIEEISALRLLPSEWESLSEEQKRLSHAAELLQTTQTSLNTIDDDENSLLVQAQRISQRLAQLVDKDPRLQPAIDAIASSAIQLEESADELRKYLDKTDLDPQRLAEVEARVEAIFTVSRKLKLKPEQLLEALTQAQEELAQANQAADIESLKKQAAALSADYQKLADHLSEKRINACQALSVAVNTWFEQLAMGAMRFEAVVEKRASPAAHGQDDIVFTLRNHANAQPYPINKVASGGELARISLAISVVTSSANNIPTLIFDEVDSGIGGNVAHTVGQLLRQLGSGRQVLCVTHLPQVAARGHQHLRVLKQSNPSDATPVSQLQGLTNEDRVDEIARMLGDEGAQKTSREHARSLLALS